MLRMSLFQGVPRASSSPGAPRAHNSFKSRVAYRTGIPSIPYWYGGYVSWVRRSHQLSPFRKRGSRCINAAKRFTFSSPNRLLRPGAKWREKIACKHRSQLFTVSVGASLSIGFCWSWLQRSIRLLDGALPSNYPRILITNRPHQEWRIFAPWIQIPWAQFQFACVIGTFSIFATDLISRRNQRISKARGNKVQENRLPGLWAGKSRRNGVTRLWSHQMLTQWFATWNLLFGPPGWAWARATTKLICTTTKIIYWT